MGNMMMMMTRILQLPLQLVIGIALAVLHMQLVIGIALRGAGPMALMLWLNG
jgi:hypothetical protein